MFLVVWLSGGREREGGNYTTSSLILPPSLHLFNPRRALSRAGSGNRCMFSETVRENLDKQSNRVKAKCISQVGSLLFSRGRKKKGILVLMLFLFSWEECKNVCVISYLPQIILIKRKSRWKIFPGLNFLEGAYPITSGIKHSF